MSYFKLSVLFILFSLFSCNLEEAPLPEGECGNGVLNKGEECDNGIGNSDISPDACRTDCTLPRCGDGILDENEKCDSAQLGNFTCSSLGFDNGILSCNENCEFDVSRCSLCGNGVKEESEECDTDDLGGANCETEGFQSGVLKCGAGCKLDKSSCVAGCGNGVKEEGEECDADDLGGASCESEGFLSGTLKCDTHCKIDRTLCISGCGNGIIDPGETCDDGNNISEDGCSFCMSPSGDFEKDEIYSFSMFPTALATADTDSDGIKDIFVTQIDSSLIDGSLLLFKSSENFAVPHNLDSGVFIKLLPFEDSEGKDCILAVKINETNATYLIIKDSQISETFQFPERPTSWTAGNTDSLRGDEIFIVGHSSQKLYLFNNGSFEVIYDIGGNTGEITVVDIKNDGLPDLAFLRLASQMLGIFTGTSGGIFNYNSATYIGGSPSALIAADMEPDGFEDLLITDRANPYLYIFRGVSSGFSYRYSMELQFSADRISAAYLNGDNFPDLVLGFPEIKTVSIFSGNGNWSFSNIFNVENCSSPQLFATKDVTGDGLTDLVLVCGENKKLFIYKALPLDTM